MNGGRVIATPRAHPGRGRVPARVGPRLEFVLPRRESVSIRGQFVGDMDVPLSIAPATNVVRFGLWNNAYALTASGSPGALRNGDADADCFIGSDVRRFFLRLVDPALSHRPSARHGALPRTVTVKLGTKNDDDSPCDVRSGDAADITLVEDAGSAGTFISRPLLLVNRTEDLFVPTNPGLPRAAGAAAPPNRVYGEPDHRVRLATMYGKVEARYAPRGRRPVDAQASVFTPDERKQMDVEVIAFATTTLITMLDVPTGRSGQVGVVPGATRSFTREEEMRRVRQVFTQVGIDPVFQPPLRTITLPQTIQTSAGPRQLTSVANIDEPTYQALQTAFPPSQPHFVRLLVVESFDPALTPGGVNTIGLAPLLALIISGPSHAAAVVERLRHPFTGAHELTHLLGVGHAPTTDVFHLMHPAATAETGPSGRLRVDVAIHEAIRQHLAQPPSGGGTPVLHAPDAAAIAAHRSTVIPPDAATLQRV